MASVKGTREIRRAFYRELWRGLRLVWPVLSVLVGVLLTAIVAAISVRALQSAMTEAQTTS